MKEFTVHFTYGLALALLKFLNPIGIFPFLSAAVSSQKVQLVGSMFEARICSLFKMLILEQNLSSLCAIFEWV